MKARFVDSKRISLFSGAGAAALFLLAACQQSENPVQSRPQDTGVQTRPIAPVGGESRLISDAGRKATDAEVARFLATREDAPAVESPEGPSPLAKSAALPTCIVDFNNVNSLAVLPQQANHSIAHSPFYKHPCNTIFMAHANPIGALAYRLIPENPQWCSGASPYIGYTSGASCIGQTEGKFWPRRAANVGWNTGVQVLVKNSVNVTRNFELQAIYIHSGVAEIVAYRPGIGWWVWNSLTAGSRWTWPAGTAVSEIQVYSDGRTDPVQFDNVEIGIL